MNKDALCLPSALVGHETPSRCSRASNVKIVYQAFKYSLKKPHINIIDTDNSL